MTDKWWELLMAARRIMDDTRGLKSRLAAVSGVPVVGPWRELVAASEAIKLGPVNAKSKARLLAAVQAVESIVRGQAQEPLEETADCAMPAFVAGSGQLNEMRPAASEEQVAAYRRGE